jgi:hypothetical protein
MAENTETKYPITAELLKGLTGHTFGDSECEMINMAIDADNYVRNSEFYKQKAEQQEIQVIEKFKEYERLKTKR